MIILIDSNALCHQAKHSVNLDYQEMQTGIIFLFLRKIVKLAKTLQSNHLIFTWDSRKSKRKEIFPEYKANRHKDRTPLEQQFDNGCYKQFNSLKSIILPKIGFECYEYEGFEADDILASIVKNNEGPFTIVTSDSDFYQLLREDVSLFWKDQSFTLMQFKHDFEIEPKDWITVKSLAGCKTDNVPGIEGVGETTACKYIRGELSPKSKAYQRIVSQKGIETALLNMSLVKLPLKGTPNIQLKEQSKLSLDAFVHFCGKYGFESMLGKEYLQSCQKTLNLQ
jgi:DNA polymerase-1